MKNKVLVTYIILCIVSNSRAQIALDTIQLPEVRLNESRLVTHNIGTHHYIINTKSLAEGNSVDLANLCNQASSIYIKQYGALATPALRGTTSSHTLVFWNGIPINSIANGLSDFSAIYCHPFSEVIIVNGGSASIFGSGSVGGNIHLNTNNKLIKKNNLLFSLTQGSYGFSSTSLRFSINNGKLTTNGNIHYLHHDNNFEYINTTQLGSPLSVNEYGKIKSNSQNIDLVYRLNNNTNFNFSLWNSDLEREVAQNMTVPLSDAKQYDISKRLLFRLKHKIDLLSVEFKQAYLQEDFRYTELLKNIDSYYITNIYISDADIKLLKDNYLMNIGGAFTNNQINNNNYSNLNKNENNIAAFSALQYESLYFACNAVLRKEWQTNFNVPLIPLIALDFNLFPQIKLRAKYNRNFRSPTYNDRFWVGSGAYGNQDLIPENAWNKEIGFDYNVQKFKISITGYHLNISDMIVWQQMENGTWTPNNIDKVLSRGVEASTNLKYKNMSINCNYTLTRTTNEVATNNLDNSVGQQVRYVPIHNGSASLTLIKNNITFNLISSYRGEVITSYGVPNNKILEDYLLTDLSLQYKSDLFPITFQAKIKNMMNKSYITYQNYPNPGREYLLTMEYIIN